MLIELFFELYDTQLIIVDSLGASAKNNKEISAGVALGANVAVCVDSGFLKEI